MKNKSQTLYSLFCFFLISIPFNAFSNTLTLPQSRTTDFIQYNAESIAKVKLLLQTGKAKKHTQSAYHNLIEIADSTLKMTNPSVMDKVFIAPSKDKHDYLSLSRYWWPDPNSVNGLPWIRKDGVTNPDTQNDDVDRKRLGRTVDAIKKLSLAYYFSDDEKYAQKAISLISTWFLDTKTKMNAHLTYAQSVPGNANGRRSGILDGRIISERVLDAITMISKSPSWTPAIEQQINQWLSDYLTWLTTSELGLAGAKQTNNHGSWYRFQVASLAWYLHDDDLLKQAVIAAQQSLSEQLNEHGAQEHELQRTRGFFYSCFNLQALARIANIAEKGGLSLWQYQSPEGHSLKLAIDYLMPVTRGEKWPHASKKIQLSQMVMILGEMVPYTDDPQYHQALKKIITDLGHKKTLSRYEQKTYDYFALLNPELME